LFELVATAAATPPPLKLWLPRLLWLHRHCLGNSFFVLLFAVLSWLSYDEAISFEELVSFVLNLTS
jgi:hypothetical protein